jgi:hypothetical protein
VSDSQRDTSKMQSGDLPTGSRIADHAKALGERHPDWWKNEGPHGEIRKCNLFADRVYRDTKVPLPWDGGHIPTVHGMVGQLSKSPDWEAVYTDKKAISDYKPQAGDFALWDKNMNFANYGGTTTHLHLEHSGVIGKEGEIMYAGSSATHGYAESDLKAMSAAATFGPPSVIFRSKHLSQ